MKNNLPLSLISCELNNSNKRTTNLEGKIIKNNKKKNNGKINGKINGKKNLKRTIRLSEKEFNKKKSRTMEKHKNYNNQYVPTINIFLFY